MGYKGCSVKGCDCLQDEGCKAQQYGGELARNMITYYAGSDLSNPDAYDDVRRPSHYIKGRTIEPLSVIVDWKLDFCEGNIVKYLARWRTKGGVQDLYKARVYLEELITGVENE